ncbi:hypothetical protein FPHOBKDP_00201 [Listeria phage LPJP1]|nr:hypothetical protein FPHOBKDP_00201 [Listeria phage LPJP1]
MDNIIEQIKEIMIIEENIQGRASHLMNCFPDQYDIVNRLNLIKEYLDKNNIDVGLNVSMHKNIIYSIEYINDNFDADNIIELMNQVFSYKRVVLHPHINPMSLNINTIEGKEYRLIRNKDIYKYIL